MNLKSMFSLHNQHVLICGAFEAKGGYLGNQRWKYTMELCGKCWQCGD